MLRRGSRRAAAEVTGHQYETIGAWLHVAARHAEALTPIVVHDLQRSTVAVDECWSCVRSRTALGHPPLHRRLVRMGWPPR